MPRLALALIFAVLIAHPTRAATTLEYDFPHHLAGPDHCEPFLAKHSSFRRWVDCVYADLPAMDPDRRSEFGEHYDPQKWRDCRYRRDSADSSCDIFRLRRRPEPEYWPEGMSSPRLAWPAQSINGLYQSSMTPREYFDALCAAEAGEFIYRQFENVTSVYEIRPRIRPTQYELQDRYVLSDPFGLVTSGGLGNSAKLLARPDTFAFVETPNVYRETRKSHVSPLIRFTAPLKPDPRTGLIASMPTPAHKVSALYGYTWREIRRIQDRQMGIAGGELVVVDLRTHEILALRRGFAMSVGGANPKAKLWWLGARICPRSEGRIEYSEHAFIQRVLVRTPGSGGLIK